MKTCDVLIIGGGLAGLCTAIECEKRGIDYLLIERRPYWGGISATWKWDGFTLDFGPHIFSAGATDEAKEWFKQYVPDVYERPRNDVIRVGDTEYPYPIQSRRSLADWISCDYEGEVTSYRHFVLKHFGRRLHDEFFSPWNEKEYDTNLASLDYEMLGGRSPDPDAPQASYLYPKVGGMAQLMNRLTDSVPVRNVRRSRWVEHIQTDRRIAILCDGERIAWKSVVWCAPLTALRGVVHDAPTDWRFDLLHYQNLALAHVFTDRRLPIEALAVYIPHPAAPFHRFGVPRILSEANVPEGRDCLQCEVSFRGGTFCDLSAIEQRTVQALRHLGYLGDEPVRVWTRVIDRAYPVPMLGTARCVQRIRDGLLERGITLCGRAAEWRHVNMWPVVKRARKVAESI